MSLTGSDISNVRNFLQGVDAYRPEGRRRSTLPTLGPETDSSQIKPTIFGQLKTYPDAGSFVETSKFDPIAYINSDLTSSYTFPDILGNIDFRDPRSLDGIIEPFVIRDKVTFFSINFPFESNDISACLIDGNEDSYRKSDRVLQMIEIKNPATIVPFIDSDEMLGDTINGSIKIPGIFPSDQALLDPHVDRDDSATEKLSQVLSDTEIIEKIQTMSPQTNDLLLEGHKSSTSGFSYQNCDAGTDSIAYGGLKR